MTNKKWKDCDHKCCESILHLKEYLEVMKDEPDHYIKMSKIYHDIRRELGDE